MFVDGDELVWLSNSAVEAVIPSTSTSLGHRGSTHHSRHIHCKDHSAMG